MRIALSRFFPEKISALRTFVKFPIWELRIFATWFFDVVAATIAFHYQSSRVVCLFLQGQQTHFFLIQTPEGAGESHSEHGPPPASLSFFGSLAKYLLRW